MKKKIIIVVIAIIATLLVWNFFITTSNSEKIEITILGENTSNIYSLMSLEKDYEASHPNIDLVFKPEPYLDALNKSTQDFANKSGLYDIVMQYNFSLSSFMRNDYVYKLDDLKKMVELPDSTYTFEKDIFEKTWFTVGTYYKNPNNPVEGYTKVGYPFSANTMMIMYNKKMFNDEKNKAAFKLTYKKELAVPKTWEDYYEIADFFTNQNNNTYGVCIQGSSGMMLYPEWTNYLFSMNGSITAKANAGWNGDSTTKVVLNSPEALKAMKYIVSLKPYNNGNFTDVGQFEQLNLMKKGNTAMAVVWDDGISLAFHNDSTGDFGSTFGYAPIPGNVSMIGGGAFFINKQSKHPKEAFEFIIYLMHHSQQLKLVKAGLSSPLKSVYSDNEVKKMPYIDALYASLERGGSYMEAGPDADMINEVISTYIQKAWSGDLKPEDALNKAYLEILTKRRDIYKQLK